MNKKYIRRLNDIFVRIILSVARQNDIHNSDIYDTAVNRPTTVELKHRIDILQNVTGHRRFDTRRCMF